MKTVGAYEAKTHLSKLLDRVERGESITIQRHGVPIAVLQPVDRSKRMPVSEVIEEIRRLRKGRHVSHREIREMIDEGRR